MNTLYISENQSPSEVFRQFGDQVPEFMRSWLEDLVNFVEDAEEVYSVVYNNSDLDLDSPEFEKDFTEMVDQAAEYDDLKGEIVELSSKVAEQETALSHLEELLRDNGIEY